MKRLIIALMLLAPSVSWGGSIFSRSWNNIQPPTNCGTSGYVLTTDGNCISSWASATASSIANGAVTPASISTTATDDFTFPRDIYAGRDVMIPGKIYPVSSGSNYIDINHPGVRIVHTTADDDGLQVLMTAVSPTGVALQVQDNSGNKNFSVFANGNTIHKGYNGLASKTIAQLGALTPDDVGQEWYCSDCTKTVVCVSTGTARGAFADVSQTVLGARQFCN